MSADFWMGLAIGISVGMLGTLLAVWVMHVCMMRTLRAIVGDNNEPNSSAGKDAQNGR